MRQLAGLCSLILLVQFSSAQSNTTANSVSEADARQHLKQKIDPVYPPIAAAARIEGDVVISVLIDAKGIIA